MEFIYIITICLILLGFVIGEYQLQKDKYEQKRQNYKKSNKR